MLNIGRSGGFAGRTLGPLLKTGLPEKVKTTMPWTYAVSDLKSGEIVETFYKRYLQKTNQKREKTINFMLNGKTTIILSAVGLMKKTQYKRVNIFQN